MGSLKRNFIYQSLYQILIVILPLINAPYVARVLGVDNSGIHSFTHTIANYFEVFCMLGLEQYGNRSIAKVRDDQDKLNRKFSELFALHLFISLVAILFYFVYCFTLVKDYRTIFLLQSFYVVSTLFDVNWFFFGIEKFKLTVTRNSIIKILTVIAIFLFVKNENDLGLYTFILSLSAFVSQLAIWPMLRKYVKFVKVSISSIIVHVKPLSILFVAVIAANLNRMIDKAMLGWFDKITELGCYDYADKIVRIPLSFIAALGTVMLSKMSNLFAKDERDETQKILDVSACLVLILSVGMGFGIAAIAPEFVILFLGKEYTETIPLLMILSLSIPLVGWNNYVRTQILIPKEMDMVYTRAVTVGAIVNILINVVAIRFLGAIGASIATVVSYAVILVIQIVPIKKDLGNSSKYVLFPLVAGFVMYVAVRIGSRITDQLIGAVCIELILGTIVYGGLAIAYLYKIQPKLLKSILNQYKL